MNDIILSYEEFNRIFYANAYPRKWYNYYKKNPQRFMNIYFFARTKEYEQAIHKKKLNMLEQTIQAINL